MADRRSLYPSTLFHFTNQEGLFGILERNFRLSYSRERIRGPQSERELAVPMVSFCDLRLSELFQHMSKYGEYGIGLSKAWAYRSGLNPVFYMSSGCPATDRLLGAINGLFQVLESQQDLESYRMAREPYNDVMNLLRYVKNYEGTLARRHKTFEDYRFADEREWRYVPPWADCRYPILNVSHLNTREGKAQANQWVAELHLDFEPEDIKYIVVRFDRQRLGMLEHLKRVKMRFADDDVRRLSSRILTADQIRDDL